MDFDYTADQQALREQIHEFIAREMTPEVLEEQEELGDQGPLVRAVYEKIAANGWRAIDWPREYGGQGGSRLDQYIVEEEFGRVGLVVGAGGSGAETILAAGTKEQKEAFLPKLINGEWSFCLGLAEPSVGADLAGLQCTATKDGDDWVINGQKMYTSDAQHATHIYLLARTNPQANRNAGISIFLVPMNTPGITVRPLWTIQNAPPAPMGTSYGDARTNETFFDNVRVPADCLLGEADNGWNLAAFGMNLDRIGARQYLLAVRPDEDFINWIKDPANEELVAHLSSDPAMRDRIAELWVEAQVARLMTLRSVSIMEHNETFSHEGAAEKVWAAEHGVRATEMIAQILGPYAQLLNGSEDGIEDGLYAHNMLGAIEASINQGSTQVIRDQVAVRGLGLPRGR